MKKNILKLLSILLFAFLFIGNVNATKIVDANETLIQEGEYDSVRLIAGNNLTNKATIDGISFGAGNNVLAEGKVTYGFYAGNVININEEIEKDLFVAGNNINIGDKAKIGRDVFIAGNSISVNANIPRDLRVGGSTVTLGAITIEGDAVIEAERITFSEETVITGTLHYPSNAEVVNIDKASIGNIDVQEVSVDDETARRTIRGLAIGTYITFLVAAIITLLIVLVFLPGLKTKLDKEEITVNEVLRNALFGLGLLVAVPFASVFTIFTGILTPITIIILVLYGICCYLASLFTSYIVGSLIYKAIFKKNSLFLSALMGVLVVRLLSLIPVFGGLISFIALIYGFGLIFKYIRLNVKKK